MSRTVVHAVATTILAVVLALLGRPGAANAQVVYLQAARLDGIATTITADVEVRTSLGSSDEDVLPAPGRMLEYTESPLVLTLMLGAGVSLAGGECDDDGPTAVGHLGLLYRTEWFFDRAGLLAFGSARPFAGGPAVRLEMLRAFGLELGGLWFDESRGFRWFAALDVSVPFLRDLTK